MTGMLHLPVQALLADLLCLHPSNELQLMSSKGQPESLGQPVPAVILGATLQEHCLALPSAAYITSSDRENAMLCQRHFLAADLQAAQR